MIEEPLFYLYKIDGVEERFFMQDQLEDRLCVLFQEAHFAWLDVYHWEALDEGGSGWVPFRRYYKEDFPQMVKSPLEVENEQLRAILRRAVDAMVLLAALAGSEYNAGVPFSAIAKEAEPFREKK